LDYIVINDLSAFGKEENSITLMNSKLEQKKYPLSSKDEIAKIYNTPTLISAKTLNKLKGNTAYDKKLKNKVKIGAIIKITLLALLGIIVSLIKSFKPSAKGCKTPNRPTTLGPLRLCIPAITFLSNNVKKATEISLSKKECELLAIFVAHPNQIIKREDLMKQVWEDNGVFVGRSLDTYISKLRKKLQTDESIKLTNVHGVGYKLEVN
jgi:hypothetical protein